MSSAGSVAGAYPPAAGGSLAPGVGEGDAEAVGAGGLLLAGGSGDSVTGGGEVGVGTGGVTQAQVGVGTGRTGARPRTDRPEGLGAAPPAGAAAVRVGVGRGTGATPRTVGAGDAEPVTAGSRLGGGATSSLASALRPPTTAKYVPAAPASDSAPNVVAASARRCRGRWAGSYCGYSTPGGGSTARRAGRRERSYRSERQAPDTSRPTFLTTRSFRRSAKGSPPPETGASAGASPPERAGVRGKVRGAGVCRVRRGRVSG